jgi:hypothetical protein
MCGRAGTRAVGEEDSICCKGCGFGIVFRWLLRLFCVWPFEKIVAGARITLYRRNRRPKMTPFPAPVDHCVAVELG